MKFPVRNTTSEHWSLCTILQFGEGIPLHRLEYSWSDHWYCKGKQRGVQSHKRDLAVHYDAKLSAVVVMSGGQEYTASIRELPHTLHSSLHTRNLRSKHH